MSLVSEALKKAQREAARREGRDKGLPEPLVAGAQPWRARRGSRVPIVVTLAAGLLAVAVGLLFFASRSGDETPRNERSPEKGPAKAVEAEVGPADLAPPAASPPSVPAVAPIEVESPAPTPTGDSTDGSRAAATAPSAPPSGSPQASPPPANVATAPLAAATRREATFVRTARLASGAEIRLGGIAWSETAPLAYVNGKLLGVGESAAGARVERIERQRIVLLAPEGRLVITLR
jgi:hypothetical protein